MKFYVILLALVCGFPQGSVAQSNGEAFREDFDQLSPERWFVSNGWANGDHQNCLWLEDRVAGEGGILRLSLTDDPAKDRAYSCAEIQTHASFGYGVYEARMKIPYSSGINANFFSHIGAPQQKPHNEIDFEFIGKREGALQTNYFVNDVGGHEVVIDVPDAAERFSDYAFVWEPNRLRWFLDGRMIREVAGDDVPSERQKIYLSVWSTDTLTDWLGPFRYPGAPLNLDVDWTSFTPAGAACQFPESLVCALEEASAD